MKRIDEYVNNIYKGFDDTDSETQILIEETTSHLYDEVEDLKSQGFSEEESIKKAILSFGKEKSVIKELKGILRKQDKFSKVLLRIALIIFFIATVLKVILFGGDMTGASRSKYDEYMRDNSCSYYVLNTIEEKLNNKDSMDDSLKNEITKFLDEFNERRYNGIYNVSIEKNSDEVYEYNKEISDEASCGEGMSSIEGGWIIRYKTTGLQHSHDCEIFNKAWEPYEKIELVNYFSIYLAGLSWIIACISFVYKIYVKNKMNNKNIAYFSIATILVIGLIATGLHTFEESVIFVVAILLIISSVYNKRFIEN